LVSVRRRFRLASLGFAALVALLAACSEPRSTLDDVPDASGTPGLPTGSLTPEQQASDDALSVYKAFWTAQSRAANAGEFTSPDMQRYGTDPLLSQVSKALAELASRNLLQTGEIVQQPKVIKVDLAASPPTVTIQDCIDERGLKAVSRTNRSPVASSSTKPYVTVATVIRSPDRRWLVSTSKPQAGLSC
jgi:hypothetical protein